jgi:hypothetical protein
MSRCGVNRWGPGTTCDRPINTESAKELRERMSAMAAERTKQDGMWIQQQEPQPQTQQQEPQQQEPQQPISQRSCEKQLYISDTPHQHKASQR